MSGCGSSVVPPGAFCTELQVPPAVRVQNRDSFSVQSRKDELLLNCLNS